MNRNNVENVAVKREAVGKQISRRSFPKAGGATTIGILAVPSIGAGSPAESTESRSQGMVLPLPLQQPDIPYAPLVSQDPTAPGFFTHYGAQTILALAARDFPDKSGDPAGPEAGVLIYVDSLLSGAEGCTQYIYRLSPATTSPEDGQLPLASNGQFEVIWIQKEERPHYGVQSPVEMAPFKPGAGMPHVVLASTGGPEK